MAKMRYVEYVIWDLLLVFWTALVLTTMSSKCGLDLAITSFFIAGDLVLSRLGRHMIFVHYKQKEDEPN